MTATPENRSPVFIAGMYKSGTSWLLRILDWHPCFRGASEFNPIVAGTGCAEAMTLLPLPERLAGYFALYTWAGLPRNIADDSEISDILIRATGTVSVDALFKLQSPDAVDAILEFYELKYQRGRAKWAARDMQELLTLRDVPRAELESLYVAIQRATDIYSAADAFIGTMSTCLQDNETLVIKGADLIASYSMLRQWQPNARKIIIVRDGRDVAVSAAHFRRLMRSAKRAHVHAASGYWELLTGWVSRVRMLREVAGDEHLAIIRYEDLLRDYSGTASAVFRWLGVDSDATLLEKIRVATCFEALTGRKPGQSAEHVIRRGIAGEWREVLSPEEAEQAWQMVGDELATLGYTRSGELTQCTLPGVLNC